MTPIMHGVNKGGAATADAILDAAKAVLTEDQVAVLTAEIGRRAAPGVMAGQLPGTGAMTARLAGEVDGETCPIAGEVRHEREPPRPPAARLAKGLP